MAGKILRIFLVGFLLGLGLAEFFHFQLLPLFFLLLGLAILFVWERRLRNLILLIAAFVLGLAFYLQSLSEYQKEAAALPARGSFIARVISLPERRDESLVFKIQTEQFAWQDEEMPYRAKLLVRTTALKEIALGDRLELAGEPRVPELGPRLFKEGVIAELSYPEINFLSSSPPRSLASFFQWLKNILEGAAARLLPAPENNFLLALLLGGSFRLPDFLREAFLRTGTQHVMAVSGFNTTVIAFTILALVRRFSRNLAILLTFCSLIVFVLLTGASPSVVRAALMTSTYFLGLLIGRPQSSLNSLFLASFFMLLFNPFLLRYDLGFQLSFLSTWGLMVFWPTFASLLPRWQTFTAWILPSLIAWLVTWPLISFHFGRLALISILANSLIAPLIPFSMLSGALLLGLGLIYFPLSLLLLPLAWGSLKLILWLTERLSHLPYNLIDLKLPFSLAVLYYLLLLLTLFGFRRRVWSAWRSS